MRHVSCVQLARRVFEVAAVAKVGGWLNLVGWRMDKPLLVQ